MKHEILNQWLCNCFSNNHIMSMFKRLKNVYIQKLHAVSQMCDTRIKANVILINQGNKFESYVTIMIIHQHQFSICIKLCIWIFDVMMQIFKNNFIWCKISGWRENANLFWQIFWKKVRHQFIILNNHHRWRKIFVDRIDHFNDDDKSFVFRIDCIMFFNINRNQDFMFLHAFNSNICFIEIDDVAFFANIQFFESIFIFTKSFMNICLVNDFKSYHCNWFCFDFMQIVTFSSISKSSFCEIFVNWISIMLKIQNNIEYDFVSWLNVMN